MNNSFSGIHAERTNVLIHGGRICDNGADGVMALEEANITVSEEDPSVCEGNERNNWAIFDVEADEAAGVIEGIDKSSWQSCRSWRTRMIPPLQFIKCSRLPRALPRWIVYMCAMLPPLRECAWLSVDVRWPRIDPMIDLFLAFRSLASLSLLSCSACCISRRTRSMSALAAPAMSLASSLNIVCAVLRIAESWIRSSRFSCPSRCSVFLWSTG